MAIQLGPEELEPARQGGRTWRRPLGLLVSAVALGWVGVLLWQTWPAFVYGLSQVDRSMLLVGFVLVAIASALVFEAFRPLARVSGITGLSPLQLGHLHFTAQLLRHLPGRIWGIGYQIVGGRPAGSPGVWLVANGLHMGLAIYFALLTSAVVLLFQADASLAMLAAATGMGLCVGAWRLSRSPRLARLVKRIGGRTGAALEMVLDSVARAQRRDLGHAALAFVASWIAMYGAWMSFALAYPDGEATDGIRLLALYMIAWFAGYASLLSPSGLGVRELVFAALAQDAGAGAGAGAIAYFAVAGRISLLASDLLLGLFFAPFAPARSEKSCP